jgi:hypothetical protein
MVVGKMILFFYNVKLSGDGKMHDREQDQRTAR